MSIETLALQGRDRIHCGLAAVESDRLRQMRDAALRACFTRMEDAAGRMEYINDAAARSVNATWYSLRHLEGGVVWIAFGGDSQADYRQLCQPALCKVRMLVCVGSDNSHLHQAFHEAVPIIRDADSIADAVHIASSSGLEGAKVLFSPATRHGLSDDTASRLFRHEVNEL